MQALLGDIAAGVLVNVITATGRWIATSVGSGRAGRDGDIAAWFDTYELTGRDLPDLAVPDEAAKAWLESNGVHAVLHELLAARLTDAPEADVESLRGALRTLAWDEIGLGAPHSRRVTYTVADQVLEWADGEICELVGRFQARDPERWRAARQDAFGARIVAVLNAIDRHLTALDDRPDPKADTKWVELYRRQAMPAYGTIEPPDFARRRKVPIGDLYVPPDIIAPGAARDADGNPATIGFDDLAGRIDRTVLLGDPGGGKSTASRVLAYGWAGEPSGLISVACPNCTGRIVDGFCAVCGVSAPAAGGGETPPYPAGRSRVPFLVVLRDFAAGDGPRGSVVEHIEERLNTFHQCPAPDGAVERLLLSGGAAVIFDGLDELIDTGRRIEVTQVVEQFCVRFPLAPVLVTSRLVGYDEARLDDEQFDAYRIAGFTRDETAAYVRNWFALEDDTEADAVADAFMRESEQVTDLRANPLMLALMCILYRGEGTLPRNRPGVYAECARLLFDKWDTRRGIHVDLQARNLIEPALRHIAYWLFTRDGAPEVTEAELVARVADLLHERGFEQRHDAEAAAGEFVRFCRGRAWILGDAGTTARGEALYTFTHRTFLEYFAAAYLASVTDTPEDLARELAPHVVEGQWDVVGQLAVQIKDAATDRGAERVLAQLLAVENHACDVDDQTNLVGFAARCLDVAEVPPTLVRDITNRAFDQLRDDDRDQALWHLPLWRGRTGDVIAEVIAERVADLMDSGDRRLAARFSAYATFCAAESRNYTYWHRLERRLTDTHRDALIEMARRDDAVWMRLIDRGVITLAQGLELRDGRLDVLLKTIEVRPGGWYWTPYVAQAFSQYGAARPYWRNAENALSPDPDAAVDRIRAFAQAMPDLPAPPWRITRIEGIWLGLGDEDLPEPRDMTPAEACAATVLAMLAAEQFYADFMDGPGDQEIPACPASMVDHFDRFDALRTRAAGAPGPWPDRIDRWLRGELDFVQWRHDDEPE